MDSPGRQKEITSPPKSSSLSSQGLSLITPRAMNTQQSTPKALTVCGRREDFHYLFRGIALCGIHVQEISAISSFLAPEHFLPAQAQDFVWMPEQNLFLPASKKALKNPEVLKIEENSAQYLIKTILTYDKQRDCRMWILI